MSHLKNKLLVATAQSKYASTAAKEIANTTQSTNFNFLNLAKKLRFLSCCFSVCTGNQTDWVTADEKSTGVGLIRIKTDETEKPDLKSKRFNMTERRDTEPAKLGLFARNRFSKVGLSSVSKKIADASTQIRSGLISKILTCINTYMLHVCAAFAILMTISVFGSMAHAANQACVPSTGFTNCTRVTFSGGDQTFTVPASITSINVRAWGAGGGGPNESVYGNSAGGAGGGFVIGTIAVVPLTVLTVKVGQGGITQSAVGTYGGGGPSSPGTPGRAGASGGGYSGLFKGATPYLIAGGGGGAAMGADAGTPTSGGGGGMNGGSSSNSGFGGSGGTQSSGGAAATVGGCSLSTAGSSLQGGTGASGGAETGGGGGGGFFGGGGGSCQSSAGNQNGPGGGGSSYFGDPVVSGGSTIAGQNGTFQSVAGNAGAAGSSQWVSGIGRGVGSSGGTIGTKDSPGTAAGNGLVVIQWSVPPSVALSIDKTQRRGTTGSFIKTPATVNDRAFVGDTVQYQLVVSNDGSNSAAGATFSDPLSTVNFDSTKFAVISATGSSGTTCSASLSGSTVNGSISPFPAAGTCTVIIQAIAIALTDSTAGVVNKATVNPPAGNTNTNITTNTSSVTTFIDGTVILKKVVVGTPPTGDNGLFNLILRNPAAGPGLTGASDQGNGGITNNGTPQRIFVTSAGNRINFNETASTTGTGSNLANYTTTSSCTIGTGGGPVPTTDSFFFVNNNGTGANANVVCTITNTVKSTVTLVKKVVKHGLAAPDNTNFNLSVAGGNPTGGTNPNFNQGDGGTTGVIRVDSGAALTLSETAGTASNLANYTSSFACVDGNNASYTTGVGPVSGTPGAFNVTAPASTAAGAAKNVTCTITNTAKTNLSIDKTQRRGVSGPFIKTPATVNDRAFVGDFVQYQLVVTNTGPGDANGATFSDPLSTVNFDSTKFVVVSATGSTGTTCSATLSGSTVNGSVSPFLASGTCTVIIQATAIALTDSTTGVVNTATVSPPAGSTNINATTSSSVTTFIDGTVKILKVVVGTPPAGDNGLFNLILRSPSSGLTLNSAADQGNGGSTGTPQRIFTNTNINFNETASTTGTGSNLANYTTSTSCPIGMGGTPPGTDAFFFVGAGNTGTAANVVCTITNTVRARVTVSKISNGGTGAFSFTGSNNAAPALPINTTTAGVAANGATRILTADSTITTISEAATAGFTLVSAACTGMGPGGAATLSGSTLTLDALATAPGSNITCTFTNSAKVSVILRKAWRNGTDNNGTTSTTSIPAITAGMLTSTGSLNSTSSATPPSNSSDSSTPGTAAVGAILTLPAETLGIGAARFGTGAAAPVYSCTDGTTTINNIAQGGTVTVPASSANGTLTCTLTNAALPVVVLSKAARSGSQSPTFNFSVSGATNASQAIPFTPNDSAIQKDRTLEHTGTVGTPVSITEATTANWPSAPASVVCTDMNAAVSGNPSTIPIVADNTTSTYTVPGANMKLGANIQCVFKNEQPQVSLSKLYVGPSPDTGVITLSISGTNSGTTNAVVTAPANRSTNGGSIPFVFVNAGTTVTVSESAGAGTSLSNYDSTIICKDGNNLAYATTLVAAGTWTLTAPTGFISGQSELISCGITNTAKPPTVTIAKNSMGGTGPFDFTLSGVTTTTDRVTTTTAGTPVTSSTAHVGVAGTQVVITETATSASGYTTAVSCADANSASTGNTSSISATGTSVTIPAGNMKSAAQYVCTFTNTASTGLRVQIVKTSKGSSSNSVFNFALSGLSQSSDSINMTGPGTAAGSTTITGTPSTAVTITETSPAGWPANPVSASCLDSTSASPLVPFGTLAGNVLSIPAAKMVNGANITCTFTNDFSFSVSGRVFNDNGVGSGGIANDGISNGSEAGKAGVSVKLTNCAGTTLTTTTTDGSGNYLLGVPFSTAAGAQLCVEETNLGSSVSTGASVGSTALPSGSAVTAGTTYTYTRSSTPDRIAFLFNASTGHAGLNFGDVDLNTFTADGAKTGQAGNTVVYAHTFTAQTGGAVSFGIASAVAAPALTGWSEKIFADAGCTGTLQPGAAVVFPPAVPTTTVAGQQVCVIMQEFIPATAVNGYVNVVKVQADFTFTNAAPSLAASYQVSDITTVGTGVLDLKKQVRNVTQSGSFGVNNQAKSGELLEYLITYTNNAASPITSLAINDTTPSYTTFVSALDGTRPASLSACQKNTPANALPAGAAVACASGQTAGGTGAISFKFTGPLNPGATGNVLFRVTVD